MDKFKSGGGVPFYYWFLSGLVIGLLMGWFFHGTISMLLRLALLVALAGVIALGFYLWRQSSNSGPARGVSDIPEGNWRDIDPSGRK
ncbi:MAG: hypothetical protein M9947_13720 [Thermomicrobiales bacterium]|nr:hypothetical protein [Thermomicrobiales bacterium]